MIANSIKQVLETTIAGLRTDIQAISAKMVALQKMVTNQETHLNKLHAVTTLHTVDTWRCIDKWKIWTIEVGAIIFEKEESWNQ